MKSNLPGRILFTVFSTVDLSAMAGIIGRFTVSRSEGLTAAAVILWYLIFGAVTGVLAGAFLSGFLSAGKIKMLNYILGIIAIAVIVFVFYRLGNIQLIEG